MATISQPISPRSLDLIYGSKVLGYVVVAGTGQLRVVNDGRLCRTGEEAMALCKGLAVQYPDLDFTAIPVIAPEQGVPCPCDCNHGGTCRTAPLVVRDEDDTCGHVGCGLR